MAQLSLRDRCAFYRIMEVDYKRSVLFICSGNYYRSRIAEEYFNYLSRIRSLPFFAFSQGLIKDFSTTNNTGPISPHAVRLLESLNIPIREGTRMPQTLRPELLDQFDRAIALSREEHEPMINKDWNELIGRVEFWEVGDIGVDEPERALQKICRGVESVVRDWEHLPL